MPKKHDDAGSDSVGVEPAGGHDNELEETPDVISDPGVEGGVDAPNEEPEEPQTNP